MLHQQMFVSQTLRTAKNEYQVPTAASDVAVTTLRGGEMKQNGRAHHDSVSSTVSAKQAFLSVAWQSER